MAKWILFSAPIEWLCAFVRWINEQQLRLALPEWFDEDLSDAEAKRGRE